MAHKKKKKKSLSKVIPRMILLVALSIFAASTILNNVFMSIEIQMLVSVNSAVSSSALRALIMNNGGFEEYAASVLDTYHSIPEELRNTPDSPEYLAYFSKFNEDPFIEKLNSLLQLIDNKSSAQNLYLAAYDPETSAIVFLWDYDDAIQLEETRSVGYWIHADEEDISLFAPAAVSEDLDPHYLEKRTPSAGNVIVCASSILSEDGTVIGQAIAEIPTVFGDTLVIVFTIVYLIFLAVIIFVVILISRILMKRRIVIPINTISGAVENYSRGKQEGRTDEFYFQDLHIKTKDELEELSTVLADMETDIASYETNLIQITADQEHLRTELSVASGIQKEMLPSTFPPYPDKSEFKIYASMKPAKEVGGDFYDFFLIDEDHLCMVMADVSGKGIPAALFMMASMIILKNLASEGYSPCEVLEKANEQICRTNKLDMFVTVWLGILDLRTGVVTAANAGHEYPAVCQADGRFELMHDKHGFVVGGMEGVRYKEYSFTLAPGSSLFLYTDGLPEATNAKEELFGTDRMIDALNITAGKDPEEILENIWTNVSSFVGQAPQFDDLTMMCVTFVHPSHL